MRKPKITTDQATRIRDAYSRGYAEASMPTLAARYGVSITTIYKVIQGTHTVVRGLPDLRGTRGALRRNWGTDRAPASDHFEGGAGMVPNELRDRAMTLIDSKLPAARRKESRTFVGSSRRRRQDVEALIQRLDGLPDLVTSDTETHSSEAREGR